MFKKLIFIFLISLPFLIFSQEQDQIVPKKLTQKTIFSIDYLSVKMPNNEANMGLTGIHYNFSINNLFYAGVGMYGSVNGFRGGLFTLGLDAGLQTNLSQNIFINSGIHFGGGGGSGAPDGGGAFILLHFNIGYRFNNFSLEAGYSYINFFDHGAINSSQANIAIRVPLSFDYSMFKYANNYVSGKKLSKSEWYKKGKKHGFLMHFNNYNLQGKTKDENGINIADKTIRLAGFEYETYISNNTFLFLRADGAYHGIPAGFMDIIVGAATGLSFNKSRTHILAKFGIGAAGGGGVDIQGGFIINPEMAIEQKLFNNMSLYLNKGYFLTPNSKFRASTYGIGIKYQSQQGGIIASDNTVYKSATFKGIEATMSQEVYFNAKRDINNPKDLYKILLQINFYLNKAIYLAGQTSFANFGDAGAYAEGVFGFGLSSNPFLNNKLRLFAQLLAGGAGGGHISTGQGLIFKPGAGVVYNISNRIGLRTDFGRVIASSSGLNSTYFNLGLSYRLSFLTVH